MRKSANRQSPRPVAADGVEKLKVAHAAHPHLLFTAIALQEACHD
jgi:hypothetical protein